jgi:hypothetical protein
LIRVDDVILDGVSGSIPGKRTDIEELLLRKHEKNDFDVVLVQDLSRFTRGGAEHGMKLEYDLRAAGVEVIFVSDNLPQGDHAGIIKSVGYYAAKQHAKAISFAVSRGQMSALTGDRKTHCSVTPYGVDRLYVDAATGNPLHIIRALADGSQQKLEPKTRQVLAVFAKGERYRRQSNERSVLVQGPLQEVNAIRQMFRRKLIDGWGYWRIAQELNSMGIAPKRGEAWQITTIANILRNPVYTGRGIANRYSRAVYHMRSPNAPTPANADPRALAQRKGPQIAIRAAKDWFIDEHPHLADYLDPQLRELAVEFQQKFLEAQGKGRTPKFSRDRHTDSDYILKGLLRSVQGNHPMSGRTLGRRGKRSRYYAVSRAYSIPSAKSEEQRKIIPAEPLERAVMTAVRDMLFNADDIEQRIRSTVEQQLALGRVNESDADQLRREREQLRNQLEFIIDSVGQLGRELAAKKVEDIESWLKDIDQRLDRANEKTPSAAIDINAHVRAAIKGLQQLAENWNTPPKAILRVILAETVVRLEVDLMTRSVELELAIPIKSSNAGVASVRMCLDSSSLQSSVNEAYRLATVVSIDCDWKMQDRCFDCQRRRAA